jgi:hypothetical protein
MDNREKMKLGAAGLLLVVGIILVVINVMPSKPTISEQGAPKPTAGGARRGMLNPPENPQTPPPEAPK